MLVGRKMLCTGSKMLVGLPAWQHVEAMVFGTMIQASVITVIGCDCVWVVLVAVLVVLIVIGTDAQDTTLAG